MRREKELEACQPILLVCFDFQLPLQMIYIMLLFTGSPVNELILNITLIITESPVRCGSVIIIIAILIILLIRNFHSYIIAITKHLNST